MKTNIFKEILNSKNMLACAKFKDCVRILNVLDVKAWIETNIKIDVRPI